MIALIQRVTRASVTVEGEVTGEIGAGLLVLLGVEKDDDEQKANRLCERVLGYRIFSDAEGKMNLNVQQAGGSVLVVSQFTLAADTERVSTICNTLPNWNISTPNPNGGCAQVSPKVHHRIAQRRYMTISSNAAVSKR